MEMFKKFFDITINNLKKYGLVYLLLTLYVIVSLIFKFSVCPFKLILGIPCPGCGITRAFLALLKGDILLSLQYNPLLLLVFIFSLIFFFKELELPKFLSNNKLILISLIILIISTYILRLIFNFGIEPINFEENSILGLIIKFLK